MRMNHGLYAQAQTFARVLSSGQEVLAIRAVEIRNLVGEGTAVDLRTHPETGFRHHLFYALARRACFTALQHGHRLIA